MAQFADVIHKLKRVIENQSQKGGRLRYRFCLQMETTHPRIPVSYIYIGD